MSPVRSLTAKGASRVSPSPDRPTRATGFLDPATLLRIARLELRARLVVQGFLSGLHRSPYHGFSVEFTEYRQYSLGDDVRYVDWRLFARTDRHYLKRFEDETNLRCYLLLDLSRSMAYGSQGYSKAEYAKTAVATIAHFLSTQRDAVGLVTFDEQIEEFLPARFRAGHLHRIYLALERSPAGTRTELAAPLEQIARTARKRGLVVLVSDLLAPCATLERQLGYLRTLGHEVIVLRVLDPAELTFPFDDEALFRDLESGRELYVDAPLARQSYRRRFDEHAAELRTTCQQLGVDLYDLPTDQPLELALFDVLQARLRRGRQIARRAPQIARGGH